MIFRIKDPKNVPYLKNPPILKVGHFAIFFPKNPIFRDQKQLKGAPRLPITLPTSTTKNELKIENE